ncbi:hypothetical protein PR003_g2520 [Phytophthora rubi]|uniref:PDZ domain-containing protein n=1 Tax=Phytophthora rubi TaxID=129364 RepID=A0A6A3NVK1_9STRA|nr:hypothetical protein PR002_g353 [Phytophthora rubi]KAE9052602.1 hypothetical protein PR001_g375 [Phytophthora rubi]KAE9356092.1 hypothetical protein PR003_g2520 [Phytophthora rubi]
MEAADDASASMELARNLPALVKQLKALREDMERKSKLYDALLLSAADGLELETGPSARAANADTGASLDSSQNGMRGSIFTPFANSQLDPRASQMTLEDLSALDSALDDSRYSNTLVSRQSSIMRRQQQQQRQAQRRTQQQRPTYSTPMGRVTPDNYTVMWVSGECGISLRNFSRKDNKVGAQIAVLQHADGVTTGISNCRLGDQLVSINDERVDSLRFREIVDKLKTTRRPISLGFRTNQNVQTSPRGASSPTGFSNTTGGSRSSSFFSRASKKSKATDRHSVSGDSNSNSNGVVDEDESSDVVHEIMGQHEFGDVGVNQLTRSSSAGAVLSADRSTTTSVQSSASTLSEDVEVWCREQEEMHSDIIVLLTETVMRCEKLQQENLDQLQNLMQLSAVEAADSPLPSDRSSAASSYAATENVGKAEYQTDMFDVEAIAPATVTNGSPTVTPPRA